MVLAEQWGIPEELWDRPWGLLSVGEAQRLSLAVAHGLNRAEVLMLDGARFVVITRLPLTYIRSAPLGVTKNRHPRWTPQRPW